MKKPLFIILIALFLTKMAMATEISIEQPQFEKEQEQYQKLIKKHLTNNNEIIAEPKMKNNRLMKWVFFKKTDNSKQEIK